MSCDLFKKFELGEVDEQEFNKHLESCFSCQDIIKQDDRLMALAKSLKQKIEAPLLWDRIERSLRAEMPQPTKPKAWNIRWLRLSLIPAAAVLVLVVLFGIFSIQRSPAEGQNILAGTTLKKVEKRENAYLRAIEKLENRVLPKLSNLDIELMLIYKDKLATIDSQIQRCKEELLENPANAHLRRYMFAALLDKKETLKEILTLKPQSEEWR